MSKLRAGHKNAAAALAAVACLTLPGTMLAGTATVVLPEQATTSAGVFDADGALVRTLWSGVQHDAGKLTLEWDGSRDDGAQATPAEQYRVRVMAHHVRYVWEGVIGNTSDATNGASVHRGFKPVHDMAIDAAGDAFYVVGYNEQQNAIHRLQVSSPQRRTPLAHDDYRRVFRYAATDGTLAYFANVGVPAALGSSRREPATFVIALRVSDGAQYSFAAGQVEMPNLPGNRWESVIDLDRVNVTVEDRFRNAPSGLAVQQRGDKLLVAHRDVGEIRVFDKSSGVPQGRIAIETPGDMDVAPDDSVWVVCRVDGRPAVARYRLSGTQWIREIVVTEGLVDPVAIGVSPVDGTLVIADAGTEQLKAFDRAGQPDWTMGRAGGYAANGTAVTADKFWFSAGPTYLAFQADGSFWVGDPGNVRNLHFSVQRRYLEQIMYQPARYVVAVDPANPGRVFCEFLEFSVDYSRPLRKSWKLVRNWAAGLDNRKYKGDFNGLRSVYTLDNGRTYGVIPRFDIQSSEVVELAATGLKPTGMRLGLGEKMYPDGSLRFDRIRLHTLQVYARKVEGFDADGTPRWGAPTALGGVKALQDRDPYYHQVPIVRGMNEATYPITVSGIVVSFTPNKAEGFHLGGIRPGSDRWLWRASPSGTWEIDAAGNILTLNGTYEVDRGVQYPANVVTVARRHIVAGYHGEGWNGGQAGQWLHFLDNGLFVGQFGKPVYPANNISDARPESAGNAFSPHLIDVDGQLYLWHNDESVHAGIHRWKIEGADDIRFLDAPIQP